MRAAPLEFHIALRSEISIEASPAVVWEHLERPGEWKPSIVSIEHLDGQVGQEGETLRVCQRRADETAYVIMRTLKLEPYRWRVQALTTEGRRAADGFLIYTLEPAGTATRLVCDFVARCEAGVGTTGGATAAEFARIVNEATGVKLDADHRNLKALAERAGVRVGV
jgi:hypothetical protein